MENKTLSDEIFNDGHLLSQNVKKHLQEFQEELKKELCLEIIKSCETQMQKHFGKELI